MDIETAPVLAAIWPPLHDTNAVWVERGTYINCFAAMWWGEKKVKTYSIADYPSYESDIHDDKFLVGDLINIYLAEADLAVAHNGDRFDQKIIRTRALLNGYPPMRPVKQVDTLKWAGNIFRFDSRKLDYIGQVTKVGRKMPHQGAKLWKDCYHGDRKAHATMARYCGQDVRLLASTYSLIKAWAPDHIPMVGGISCTACQSNRLNRRGSAVSRKRRYWRLQCAECGHWQQGEIIREPAAG